MDTFQPSFDDMSALLFDVTFCVLDLETTGVSAADCAITEIGAVKHRGGELLGSFQTLVDPGLPIPPSITIMTGLTQAMVTGAPAIESALPAFLEFIGDAVIVGHNVRFDLAFLNAASTRLGYGRLPNKSVDTAALARRIIRPDVRDLRLATLAAHFRSPVAPNHRALEDARATAHVLHGLLERVGSLGVTNLDDLLQLPTARGAAHYSKISLTDDLPRFPGVYIFKDTADTPIYVGKAANLRARVRQYFYGDKRRSIADMMKELHSIEIRRCDTVIEAEIAEIRLIHAFRPRYNRRSRPPKSSHFVKLTDERYPRLSVVRTVGDNGLAYLGPFRSKRAADLVVTAIWDAVPIRRCRAKPPKQAKSQTGKCASAQLGVARCPCDGTLDETAYRQVVDILVTGIDQAPALVLDPLADRMMRLSEQRRYEEAAQVRDRHDALALAIERRRAWRALTAAGTLEAEARDGPRLVVDRGRLVETKAPPGPVAPSPMAPPDVQAAEEADLLWKWLTTAPARLVESSGNLSLPAGPVVRLAARRSAGRSPSLAPS